MKFFGSFTGGVLIIAGTTLGAGLIGTPVCSAHLGFFWSALLMAFICAFMTYMALVTLEINAYFKRSIAMGEAAHVVIGPFGRFLGSASLMLLYYALLAAYISGGSSTLKTSVASIPYFSYINNIADPILNLIFVLTLGSFILIATKAVDYCNRFLFSLKLIFFLLLIIALFPAVKINNLIQNDWSMAPSWLIIPIFITSFGYHGSIPSVIQYIGENKLKRVHWAFLLGSSLALLIYLIWQFIAVGALPLYGTYSFYHVIENNQDVGLFTNDLAAMINNQSIRWTANCFTALAIGTSFLGVGLGLFDFFLKKKSTPSSFKERIKSGFMTFLIPLIFAIYFPKGFIKALSFAGVSLTIIAVILPAWIVLKLRRMNNYQVKYRAPGGNLILYTCLTGGILVILLELLSILKF